MADGDHRRPLLALVRERRGDRLGNRLRAARLPDAMPKYDVAALIDHLVEAGYRAAALGGGSTPRERVPSRRAV